MDLTLRKVEKNFMEAPDEETATRYATELQRSGKTAVETAEQLLEATARAIKALVLEHVATAVLPNTEVLVIDENLRIMADYAGHTEPRPLLTFFESDYTNKYIGLTTDGIFLFKSSFTMLSKVNGKISRRSSGIDVPEWLARTEQSELYLEYGKKALAWLAAAKKC